MKKYIIICLTFLVFVSLVSPRKISAEEPTRIIFDGNEIVCNSSSIIEEEVILIPVRSFFEALGAQVEYDSSNQSIYITSDRINLWLQINNQTTKIGEKEYILESTIKLINSHAVMPLSLVGEVFNVCIELDKEKNIIYIYDATYGFPLTAKSNILVEPKSGLILLEHNVNKKVKIGNVAKIMNLLLIYEALENEQISLNDVVTVSEQAASMQGSQLFLEANEEILVETLIKSIIMIGANDSAMVMAEQIARNPQEFVVLMNNKAQELGMTNTNYSNITGIDEEGQYTTAYDIAILVRELITKYPEILEFSKIKEEEIIRKPDQSREIPFLLINRNKYLKPYEDSTIITGYTAGAKHCIVGITEREGFQLIAVTLGVLNSKTRFEETISMLDFGYKNYNILK